MSIADTYPLVICAECKNSGQRSRVNDYGTIGTLLAYHAYYDEDGRYHSHNPNRLTKSYRCSKGHTWKVSTYNTCPQEDYPSYPKL